MKSDFKLFRRRFLHKILRSKSVYAFLAKAAANSSVLDVGCGNNSSFYMKSIHPSMCYTGIDVGDYNETKPMLADKYVICKPEEFGSEIAKFEGCFDAVISAHNLEHCDDREKVLEAMLNAVKPGGSIFLAFPCEASVHFPKRRGTLNYYDDPTHQKKPPSFGQVVDVLDRHGFELRVQCRRYRPLFCWAVGLLLEPISALTKKIYSGTWDLYGFQSIIWARKSTAPTAATRNPSEFRPQAS